MVHYSSPVPRSASSSIQRTYNARWRAVPPRPDTFRSNTGLPRFRSSCPASAGCRSVRTGSRYGDKERALSAASPPERPAARTRRTDPSASPDATPPALSGRTHIETCRLYFLHFVLQRAQSANEQSATCDFMQAAVIHHHHCVFFFFFYGDNCFKLV